MDKEKIKPILLAIALFIITAISSCYLVRSCSQIIDQAGGLREIIIQEGKVVKSIYKDINDDNYTR
jgi:hypothetical protein